MNFFQNLETSSNLASSENTIETKEVADDILEKKEIARDPGLVVVCISDTHDKHLSIENLPSADVIIHAGDFSSTGTESSILNFLAWFESLPHPHKIFIAGNHDTTLHEDYYTRRGGERFHGSLLRKSNQTALEYSQKCRMLISNFKYGTYLEDSGTILKDPESNFEPITVYGSPWQPEFCDWAFNLDRGAPLAEKWAKIPDHTDILITHGPPYGYGDRCVDNFFSGCVDLLQVIQSKPVPPRVHIFGHIHEDYGAFSDGKTLYINASTCNYSYRAKNKPIMFHIPFDRSKPATLLNCELSQSQIHASSDPK